MKCEHTNVAALRSQRGFTLVELITIIILLGIVGIAVVPRFTGTSGFAEYAIQKRMINALRNIQLKAMYDTRANFCYKLLLDTDSSPEFGPPTGSFLSGQETASCGSAIDFTSDAFLRSDAGEIASEALNLASTDGTNNISYIQFSSLGKPVTSASNCALGCTLSITGEDTVNVCIASEGYIYAC